jgi:dihydrolipoamide dehydrogenase
MTLPSAVSTVRGHRVSNSNLALITAHYPVPEVKLNLPVMLQAKDNAVSGLTKGIEHLFRQNKVDYIKGTASFVSPTKISVSLLDGGETEVEAKVRPSM